MSKTLEASRAKKPTLQQLAEEVDQLRERVEDLEDLRDLKEAIQRNGDKALTPLAKVKRAASLRHDIREGFAAVARSEYTDYDATTIHKLADHVKSRGRKRLAAERAKSSTP